MKRTTFKIRDKVNGVDVLQEVIAEEYDEFVCYVSPRTNKDFRYKYSFYDKKSGLMICYGKNKQELINKYNEVKERYRLIRVSSYYKRCIDRYEQLKKEMSV